MFEQLWEKIRQKYALEFRAVSETEYCVNCESYMDKFRTAKNAAEGTAKGLFYHCPKCGNIIQVMRPNHEPVRPKEM